MAYRADPGGVFDSDTQRRVLGHVPVPADDPLPVRGDAGHKAHGRSLGHRISGDAHHGLTSVDDLVEVLNDLAAAGYVTESKAGFRMTKKGFDALNAPLPDDHEANQGPRQPVLLEGLSTGGSGGAIG